MGREMGKKVIIIQICDPDYLGISRDSSDEEIFLKFCDCIFFSV